MPEYFNVSESFDKKYGISSSNYFLDGIMVKLREKRPFVKDCQKSLLTFYEGSSTVQMWIRTAGCTFCKRGSCTVCDYWIGEHLENSEAVVEKTLLPYKGKYETLIVNTSGSPFDYHELTYKEQRSIWKVIDSMGFEVVIIETHMDTVDTERLKLLKECINAYLVIEMGLESSNAQVLKYALNKKVSIEKLKEKIELIHKYGMGCCTNVLLGIPFLSVQDRMDDCIHTVRTALHAGTDTCAVFPVHIKEFTLTDRLYRAGLYERVNEWELIEVLDKFSSEDLSKINVAWYKEKKQDNLSYSGSIIAPVLCENCRQTVYHLLTDYYAETNGIRRRDIIDRLSDMKCSCKNKFFMNNIKKGHELGYYYEKIKIIDEWDSKRSGCSFESVLDCMERNVRLYGDKLAVSDEQRAMSFSELHKTAGRMAFQIRQMVPETGKCIGIIASNTIDTVIDILSVLYSGSYYIVLDKELPEQTFKTVCRIADIKLLIYHNNDMEWKCGIPCLFALDSTLGLETYYYGAVADDFMYAVLTSGTTGTPKVVLKKYGSMDIFIRNYIREFALTANEIIGGLIPFYSDASAKDIFCMVYLGAELFIMPCQYFAMPYALVKSMNEKRVTMISWVPSAYLLVMRFDILKAIVPKWLKTAVVVGEQISVKVIQYWKKYLSEMVFYNTYGMSELAGVCTWYKISADPRERIPIGRPFRHCSLMFADESLRPSDEGNLLVCSEALAVGYLTDKGVESLEEAEIRDEDGSIRRYYISGDYGYLDEQGNFVVTGRRDSQIKHMGYRIELQGIEAVMMNFSGICSAVCIYDDSMIIAIIQLDKDTCSCRKDFELYCQLNLQKYMRPARYCYVNEMPLNGNRKVNRKYLLENWKGIK